MDVPSRTASSVGEQPAFGVPFSRFALALAGRGCSGETGVMQIRISFPLVWGGSTWLEVEPSDTISEVKRKPAGTVCSFRTLCSRTISLSPNDVDLTVNIRRNDALTLVRGRWAPLRVWSPLRTTREDLDSSGAIHTAVKNNNEAEVEAILDRCPSIYPILIPDHDINLPLHNAVCHASVEILQSLLHTCREGRKRQATAVNGTVQTPLHLAIWCPHRTIERQDNIEVVEALVEAGPEALAIAENQAKTPLHLAIEHDRGLDIIKVLVWGVGAEAGAEALVDNNVQTPLHLAIMHNRGLDILRSLLEYDTDAVECAHKKGQTPLHMAIEHRCGPEMVKALLEANLQAASKEDGEGCLPLHRAVRYGSV